MQLQIKSGVKQGAFFDLERTITRDAVEQVASVAMWRRGDVSTRQVARVLWCYLRYNLGLIQRFEDLKAEGARVFTARSARRDEALLEALYQERLRSQIFPQARHLIEQAQSNGFLVAIISSTYRFMVAPFARELNVSDFFGCELETRDDQCTGRLIGAIYHQERKAECVRALAEQHGLSLADSYAFGDSTNDVPMMEAVGCPVAINPGKKLRKIAEQRSWHIESWSVGAD